MKDLLSLLKRFIPPYKKYVWLTAIMSILTAVFSLVTFGMLSPILKILFAVEDKVYTYIEPKLAYAESGIKGLGDALTNDFNWYLSELVSRYEGGTALLVLGIAFIILTLFRTTAMFFTSYCMIPIRTGVVRDIRNQINDKIISLPLAFFSEERKGDILARVSGDVNEVESSVMSSLEMLFKNPILIIIYLIGMLLISWQLTVFVLLVLPFAAYVMGIIGKQLKKKSALAQKQWGGLMSQIEETLGGLRIIKAFNAEKKITDRFHKGNNQYRNTTRRVFRRQQLAHPMSEMLGTITIAIVLWFGGSLILNGTGNLDGPVFIVYLSIFYLLITPIKDLSKAAYSIQKGMASMDRIDKILKAETTITDPIDPKPIRLNDKIVYNNIRFRYQDAWVIKNVSLEVPKGKTVALVGQSGSGKSTMVDLLPRFYDVQEGQITIDGVDIRDARVKDLRSLMGIVNQEAILFNDTFFNNIAFGVDNATQEEVEEAAKIANAHEFIMASEEGYDTNIGDRGCKLSGGQRQRISIARAVLKNPPILILDEATSALDTESERWVQDALESLMKNRTTIVVAHRLSTIKHADLICVMNEALIRSY